MEASSEVEWDEEAFDAALKRVAVEGVIDARGVRLSSEQLAALLKAAPRDAVNPERVILKEADFRSATFSGDAQFEGATFSGDARFEGATFRRNAGFEGATFSGDAWFAGATFRRNAAFEGATFSGDAWFIEVTVGGHASFIEATFGGEARFDGGATFSGHAWFIEVTFSGHGSFTAATFSGDVSFDKATFSGDAWFTETTFGGEARFAAATFSGHAWFNETTFSGDAWFNETTFGGDARFDRASFERAQEFGPIQVCDRLWLDGAVFAQQVAIEASAMRVSFGRAVFRGGADVRLRWAQVWLQDSDFAEPSLVAGLSARPTPEGEKAFLGWEKPANDGTWACSLESPPKDFAPSLLSIRGARVAQLVLSGVNLRACRFAHAHGLDELAAEQVEFAHPPHGWRWVGWAPIRWTYRSTIAEEHHWRAQRYGPSWDIHHPPPGDTGSPPAPWPPTEPLPVDAGDIASLYRELRKAREDRRDEPGAADFYYGEMEMRRHSAPLAERSILWLYWLVSGYGLRASRALLALALTVLLFALLFVTWGFHPHQSFGRAVLVSVESTSSLFRVPEMNGFALTAAGEVLQVILRLAGPLLFGLALLALRGRVKR